MYYEIILWYPNLCDILTGATVNKSIFFVTGRSQRDIYEHARSVMSVAEQWLIAQLLLTMSGNAEKLLVNARVKGP